MPFGRATPDKPDRRETNTKKSVKTVTAKPKGIRSEQQEPKRSPKVKSILGQSGKRKGNK